MDEIFSIDIELRKMAEEVLDYMKTNEYIETLFLAHGISQDDLDELKENAAMRGETISEYLYSMERFINKYLTEL